MKNLGRVKTGSLFEVVLGSKFLFSLMVIVGLLAFPNSIKASQAYGSINNFDVVNDTGTPCHGFEIELDDITSAQITYTYDYNHYGTPIISTDSTDPAHPKTYVRYEAHERVLVRIYSCPNESNPPYRGSPVHRPLS